MSFVSRSIARGGMSLLLEVVVGFGLLATCVLLIFGVFPASYSTMAVAKDRSIAINLARELAEERRVAGFSDPKNATSADLPGGTLPAYGVAEPPPPLYELIRAKTIINGDPSVVGSGETVTEFHRSYTVNKLNPRVKHIVVEVRWESGAAGSATGLQRSVRLDTYVTKL